MSKWINLNKNRTNTVKGIIEIGQGNFDKYLYMSRDESSIYLIGKDKVIGLESYGDDIDDIDIEITEWDNNLALLDEILFEEIELGIKFKKSEHFKSIIDTIYKNMISLNPYVSEKNKETLSDETDKFLKLKLKEIKERETSENYDFKREIDRLKKSFPKQYEEWVKENA